MGLGIGAGVKLNTVGAHLGGQGDLRRIWVHKKADPNAPLMQLLNDGLQARGIEIPYPQRVIHTVASTR